MSEATYAKGFADGIEAVAKWHQSEAIKLVAMAVADHHHGRLPECTEVLNRAYEHAIFVPAIRALLRAPQAHGAG